MAAVVCLMVAVSPAAAERIARVVDGDTVVTASGEKVRLMGFDAPEIRGKCPRERELAQRAAALLRRLARTGLEFDRHGRDRCVDPPSVLAQTGYRCEDVVRLVVEASAQGAGPRRAE